MSLSMEQLQAIAEGLNVETKHIQDQESLVYEILDAQAIQNASQQPAKKRTRIVKKDVDQEGIGVLDDMTIPAVD